MRVEFTRGAYEDYCYWKENDSKIFNRLISLIKNIKESPFHGIGKPEPLRGNLAGYWSRRITHEHRVVYKVKGNRSEPILYIIQCRYLY